MEILFLDIFFGLFLAYFLTKSHKTKKEVSKKYQGDTEALNLFMNTRHYATCASLSLVAFVLVSGHLIIGNAFKSYVRHEMNKIAERYRSDVIEEKEKAIKEFNDTTNGTLKEFYESNEVLLYDFLAEEAVNMFFDHGRGRLVVFYQLVPDAVDPEMATIIGEFIAEAYVAFMQRREVEQPFIIEKTTINDGIFVHIKKSAKGGVNFNPYVAPYPFFYGHEEKMDVIEKIWQLNPETKASFIEGMGKYVSKKLIFIQK